VTENNILQQRQVELKKKQSLTDAERLELNDLTDSFAKAKENPLEFEGVGNGKLILPRFSFPTVRDVEQRLNSVISIDEEFYEPTARPIAKDVCFKDRNPCQVFSHFLTGDNTTSDAQIVAVEEFGFKELKKGEELISIGVSLITLDFLHLGPLYVWDEAEQKKGRNINCGYCYLEHDNWSSIYVVWVERLPPVPGKPREYHIHHERTPRLYKSHRHFLVPGPVFHPY
jgi:hypothetical protein